VNIAFIQPHLLNIGGEQRVLLELASRFARMGYGVKIFTSNFDREKLSFDVSGLPIEICYGPMNVLGHLNMYMYYRSLLRCTRRAEAWGADVLFLNTGYEWSPRLRKHTRLPILAYVHNVERIRLEYGGILSDSWTRNPARDVVLVCCSNYAQSLLRDVLGQFESTVVHPGVDIQKFHHTGADDGYLVCHGRFQRRKNQELAIKAASGMRHSLFVTGSLEPKTSRLEYFDELQQISRGYANVRLMPNLSEHEVVGIVENCSLFLLPSKEDYFPLTCLEAMAAGKPVLGLRSGGLPETIAQVSAFLLCGEDPEEWKTKIESLMADSSQRRILGKAARKVAEQFSWDSTTKQIERLMIEARN